HHYHIGLTPSAHSWGRDCEPVCERWRVWMVWLGVAPAVHGLGLEADERVPSYRVFELKLLHGEVMVTAQNLDDQCGTFLMALKRRRGPAGLGAVGERWLFGGTQLLRARLGETRKTLEQWAVRHGLC
ncbi:ATP-binding protein, partial [Salmonella enterica]|uniref:ATP-binding protein n=1 Tax=Salmonella enterica TaxID=28901 RepID=UPI00398C299B